MSVHSYRIIGVMSGTSRDGIDLAYSQFSLKEGRWSYEFLKTKTLSYSHRWENLLGEADHFDKDKIKQLNEDYTSYLAEKIKSFIIENGIKHIDAIASHGHTIFHQPERKYTLQIGNLPKIANVLDQKVICDFRVQDVELGGQGAPLVPIGDQLLFSEYQACLNLGGFANISLDRKGNRIAYDLCAVNTVLNHYANQLGLAYDDKGKIAKAGQVDAALLKTLNRLPFYSKKPPKSLGIEWVRKEIFPLIDCFETSPSNILATYTAHIATVLAAALPQSTAAKVLVTGGGAYHTHLIDVLKEKTNCSIVIPDNTLIDYKEALIFGLLGVLRLRNEVNVLKSVTGASKNHSSGVIFVPTNF